MEHSQCFRSQIAKKSGLFKFRYAIDVIAAIKQHFILNNVSWNNNDLFKFHYAISLLFDYIEHSQMKIIEEDKR